MKKLLSVCLVLIMILSVFSITASAEPIVAVGYYDVRVDDVYYIVYEDEGAYVVGYDIDDFDPNGALTIPQSITYDGTNYTVVGIETEAFYQSTYTQITLPSTITYMGDAAFMSCDYLEKVIIPDNCYFEYFGTSVFIGTPFEAEIYSKDVTIFGQNVLYSYIGNADEYVIPDNIDLMADTCFFMSGVKNVVLNDNITEIPDFAFASCRNLTDVVIPDSVETIGFGAFRDCTSLETITLGEGVAYLGEECFSNTKIKTIHLGANVHSISGAFKDCKTLESITVDEENKFYKTDENAVYFDAKRYYEDLLGSSYEDLFDSLLGDYELGYYLEYYYPSKAQGTVTLIPEVTFISSFAFYGCNNIKEVVAGSIEIGDRAFVGSSIEKITATDVLYVWDSAFRNCKNLTDIDLSATTYIGTGAFENCTALTEVSFAEDVNTIGSLAFSNTGLTEVTIYGEDCSIGESAFKGCKNLKKVTLSDGVYDVGTNAFLDCPKLETVYLSKTIEEFADNALNGCENVKFEVIKGTDGYRLVKNLGYDFEVVGNVSIFQRILDFFTGIFEVLFGWI